MLRLPMDAPGSGRMLRAAGFRRASQWKPLNALFEPTKQSRLPGYSPMGLVIISVRVLYSLSYLLMGITTLLASRSSLLGAMH
jgi:hypothetical protein